MIYDFKDESQVKEYLNNVEIEYKFQCLKENSAEGCHRLANFYESVRKNSQKACEVFKKNCDENNYRQSCFKYANYKILGKGSDKDLQEAYNYHKIGCSSGYNQACHSCGLMNMSTEMGVAKDYEKAMDYFRKACDNEHSDSCYKLSSLFLKGIGNMPKDKIKAFEYSKKACELGHMFGCSNVCVMYTKGDGVDKNKEMAAEYREKALALQTALRKKQQDGS